MNKNLDNIIKKSTIGIELSMRERSIINGLKGAISKLLNDDQEIIYDYKVKEEAISHRLGCYLRDEFEQQICFLGCKVDCEYNKFGEDEKTAYGKRIRPDIIIHKRGNQNTNILAIEIKKRRTPNNWDIKKLKYFTSKNKRLKYKYRYKLSLFIGFGENPSDLKERWFKEGKEITEIVILLKDNKN